jgi:1,3-beta-glucanosyltransferase GAS1
VVYRDPGTSASGSLSISDLLAGEFICNRDIPYIQRLGVNTLVVDVINPNLDHSPCMRRLAGAGIYILLFLNGRTAHTYLDSYGFQLIPNDYRLWEHMETTVEQFRQYPNILGFLIGLPPEKVNETSKYKAYVRDVKRYLQIKEQRNIPIGVVLQYPVRSKNMITYRSLISILDKCLF